jgi:hypothetical protein
MVDDVPAWIEHELEGCQFADERLGRRLRSLLDQMAGAMGESIPFTCQDWANTKAAPIASSPTSGSARRRS